MLTTENEKDISKIVVDCIFKVHQSLGPGLLESTYELCLDLELRKRKLKFKRQKNLPIKYDNEIIENAYRLDFLIENSLIIELKSCERILPIHEAQILTYLKLSNIKTGLLVNFNNKLIKDGIKRFSI